MPYHVNSKKKLKKEIRRKAEKEIILSQYFSFLSDKLQRGSVRGSVKGSVKGSVRGSVRGSALLSYVLCSIEDI